MKKKYLLLVLVTATFTIASFSQASLDINNIKAKINPAGDLFWDVNTGFPAFEAPKGSGLGTMFAADLWIGGVDGGGQLKTAAQTYRQSGTDFWPGPVDTQNISISAQQMAKYNKVWKINKSSIDSFIAGWPATSSILNWPGNGDVSQNESVHLAPYFDKNGDGLYNPASGDYPLIRGDQAIFFVYNDVYAVHTQSGGTPIGLEIRGMAYSFNCATDSALANTIFIHYEIINRSALQLNQTYIGLWADFDIGCAMSDFQGSDVNRQCFYGYNGTATDAACAGSKGYGSNLAAEAVVFLRGPSHNYPTDGADSYGTNFQNPDGSLQLSRYMYYNNNASVTGEPTTAGQYYGYLAGNWKDGTALTYGGTGKGGSVTADFAFPGSSDPSGKGTGFNSQATWTEATAGNVAGDRRGIGSCGPLTMTPGSKNSFDVAFVFGRDYTAGGINKSLDVMNERVDSIRSYYAKNSTPCGEKFIASVNKIKQDAENLFLYPNPANNKLTVQLGTVAFDYSLEIYDITGALKLKLDESRLHNQTIDIAGLSAGMYFLRATSKEQIITKRFIKQ